MPQMARHISTGIALLISKENPCVALIGCAGVCFCYSSKIFSTGAKVMLSIPNLHIGQIQTQLPSMNRLPMNFSSIFKSFPFTQATVPQHWHLKPTANFSFSLQVRLSSEVLSFMFFLSPLCRRCGYTVGCALSSSCISDFLHCAFEIWHICFRHFTFDTNNRLRDSRFV